MRKVPLISVTNVSFSYDEQKILHQVNFTIKEGQFISLVGPNGGGKTTLLRLLLGLLKPDTGKIEIMGKPPYQMRENIGYVPQFISFDQYFPVTVGDVLLTGRMHKNLFFFSQKDKEKAYTHLKEVGLPDFWDRPFYMLSGGQRQRVLIARALTSEPKLLFLDEPTASVDTQVGKQLRELLASLSDRMTILLVTHDVGFASHFVQHVVCVNKTVRMHPTKEIDDTSVENIYGDTMRLIQHDIDYCIDENPG